MTRCKYWDCGWCYCKTGNSNDINGKCMSPMECQQLASQRHPQQHLATEYKVMSNEKMREEFEAWVIKQNVCVKYGAKLTQCRDGSYKDYRINDRWNSWQASRSALCVELPRCWNDEQRDYRDDMVKSLDSAGVSHK